MQCPVCKGTGVMALPHVPGARGGWLDKTYNFSDLKCGACDGTGVRQEGTGAERPQRSQGAEEQLHTTRQLLIYTWQYSQVFPPGVTAEWIEEIGGLDVYSPEAGKAVLASLRDSYEWAKRQHRPVRDTFSINPSNELRFLRETSEIDQHLAYLDALMDHAIRWLRDNPDDGEM